MKKVVHRCRAVQKILRTHTRQFALMRSVQLSWKNLIKRIVF